MSASILILADHSDIAQLIARCLVSAGYRPLVASDIRHAALVLQRERPDAVVLDLAMPGQSDSAVQWFRQDPTRAQMALVRVSGRMRHGAARGTGAELSVPKPFTPKQIVDAVRTVLMRRTARLQMAAGRGAVPPPAVLRSAPAPATAGSTSFGAPTI